MVIWYIFCIDAEQHVGECQFHISGAKASRKSSSAPSSGICPIGGQARKHHPPLHRADGPEGYHGLCHVPQPPLGPRPVWSLQARIKSQVRKRPGPQSFCNRAESLSSPGAGSWSRQISNWTAPTCHPAPLPCTGLCAQLSLLVPCV